MQLARAPSLIAPLLLNRQVRMLPHLIGSVFFQKKKQPIVIDVRFRAP